MLSFLTRKWAGVPWLVLGVVCLALLGSLATRPWWAKEEVDLDAFFAQLPAIEDHMVRKAVENAQQDIRANPHSADVWGNMGMVLYGNDMGRRSQAYFERAEQLDAANPRWPHLQGLLVKYEDPAKSVPFFEKAVALSASNSFPALRLAETYFSLGQYPQAQALYEKILRDQPDNEFACFGMGRLAWTNNDLGSAKKYLGVAKNQAHTAKAAYQILANIYSQEHNPRLAQHALNMEKKVEDFGAIPDPFLKEVEQKRTGKKMFFQKARELQERKQERQAVEIYAKLLENYPDEPRALGALGIINGMLAGNETDLEKKRNLLDLAVACFTRAEEVDPALAHKKQHLLSRGLVAEERARYLGESFETAIGLFQRAATIGAADPVAFYQLASCHLQLKNHAEAKAVLQKSVELRSDFLPAFALLADLHWREGDVIAAGYYYSFALSSDQDGVLEKMLLIYSAKWF